MKKTILVTGGTGFIGSHTTVELQNAGYNVVIIDNLSNSKADVVDGIEKITGITAELMQDALAASDVVSELMRDLAQAERHKPIKFAIAHYAQFEQAFINQLFADHLPSHLTNHLPGHSNDRGVPFQFICTCQIAKRLYPDLPSRAIRALGGYFGLSLTEMKRSSCHVEAT